MPFFLTLRRFGRVHAYGRFLRKIEEQLVQRDRELHPFSKTTDFERIATKRYQIPGLRDLRFSKTILEMIFSK
jgi:hypothetical protein